MTMKNAKAETIAARLAELLTSLHGDVFLEVLLAMLKHNILVTSNENSPTAIDKTRPVITITCRCTYLPSVFKIFL